MSNLDNSFRHFEKVVGKSKEHLNNVLFSRVSHPTGTVVFFGGDGEFNL
jgi:hypothetical protein